MIRTILVIVLIATPAFAGKPTAVLCNGAFQFQPGMLTPLASLGRRLEQQGWRVVIDNHILCGEGEEPVLIVGHSAGGASALAFAKRQVEQTKFHPTVVLLDAAPWWSGVYRSHVEHCFSIRTPEYPKIPRCKNIDAPPLVMGHVTIPFSDSVQRTILSYSATLLK